MRKFIDLTGQKFNRLIPIEFIGKDKWGNSLWSCKCDCGKQTTVSVNNLRQSNTKSCGCLRDEKLLKRNLKHEHSKKNKISKTYVSWQKMNQRCTNSNRKDYKNYGGRIPPIIVRHRWSNKNPRGFINFLEDMGEKPEGKTLERIDNDLGYYKENCMWATRKEQARNRRNNVHITFNGETHILMEWAEILGINYVTLWTRIYKYKWSIKKAFITPLRGSR